MRFQSPYFASRSTAMPGSPVCTADCERKDASDHRLRRQYRAGSLWFHSRYPGAHIVALSSLTLRTLRSQEELAVGTADIVEGAVAQDDAVLTFVDTGSTLSNQIADGGHTGAHTYSVNGYSLASIVGKSAKEAVPFILKLDVEGAEQFLFQKDVEVAQSFPMIIIEPHDFMIPGKATSSNFLKFHAEMKRDFLFLGGKYLLGSTRIVD